jgi:flagellar hook assembly protein FlgD
VTLDDIHITNVSRSPVQINPLVGETVTLRYAIDKEADVTFKLYDEERDEVVKTFSDNTRQVPGSYEYSWDGKNEAGERLPLPNVYYFTIEAQDGTGRMDRYLAPVPFPVSLTGNNPATFNAYANELLPISFNITHGARVSLSVFVNHVPVRQLTQSEPFSAGDHVVYWDGRDAAGNLILPGFDYIPFSSGPAGLPENAIITKDDTLKVETLRANAYTIVPIWGEVSEITYTLPVQTRVTLNIKDPNGNHFRNVITNELKQAGSYNYLWDGTNDAGDYFTIPGHYTLEFLLENPSRLSSGSRRGNVTVRD